MILTRLIPFAENLFDCNVASNMLHNDVTLLNVCYSQKDDKLYLIDFELLKPAGSKPLNSDIVSIIRNIVSELVPLMTYGQQVFFRQVKDIPTSALTIDVVKSILQGLVELDE
jgi:aminoglycoside phosphotransferase (APT) family kinase protein